MSRRNTVVILGDAMVDTYIYGNVERVSPEAPVPVIRAVRKVNSLGGAANVAQNAVSLGARVSVLFVVGDDENGAVLRDKLAAAGVDCDYVFAEPDQRTVHKMRVVGNNQQIARVDWHDSYDLATRHEEKLLHALEKVLPDADIVVISDYAKGTCTETLCREAIRLARQQGKPVLVDPKGTNWEKYAGASVITPNLKEINAFSGLSVPNDSNEIEAAYGGVCSETRIDNVLLTRSECGMTLFQGRQATHFPTRALEVFDVSGAGDTVVAALASVLEQGMDNLADSVEIANIAAGIAVGKPGTATVTLAEVKNQIIREDRDEIRMKIYTEDEWLRLLQTVRFWRMAGDRIVTTNGCFDILHRGHVWLLEEAHKLGTRLIVAINADESVRRLKGPSRPVNSQMDRAYLVAALKTVDAVVLFDPRKTPCVLSDEQRAAMSVEALAASEEAPMKLMQLVSPDVHVKGGDYSVDDIPESVFAHETVCVPFMDGYSTTGTIREIRDPD